MIVTETRVSSIENVWHIMKKKIRWTVEWLTFLYQSKIPPTELQQKVSTGSKPLNSVLNEMVVQHFGKHDLILNVLH